MKQELSIPTQIELTEIAIKILQDEENKPGLCNAFSWAMDKHIDFKMDDNFNYQIYEPTGQTFYAYTSNVEAIAYLFPVPLVLTSNYLMPNRENIYWWNKYNKKIRIKFLKYIIKQLKREL